MKSMTLSHNAAQCWNQLSKEIRAIPTMGCFLDQDLSESKRIGECAPNKGTYHSAGAD